MRPLAVINGIVLGSSASIAFSLGAVALIFLILSGKYPRLAGEFPALLRSLAIFTAMTAISGASFYSLVRKHRWRWYWQVLNWVAVAVLAWLYRP